MTQAPPTFHRICIFGAGAIGGGLAARLAQLPGTQVSVIARGPHLAAIRARGLRLEIGAEEVIEASVTATDRAADLGVQDLVFVTLKGHQLPGALDELLTLIGPETRLVFVQNGIPWWYFHADTASGHAETQLEELDPAGRIWAAIDPARVIGGVVYQGASMKAPGTLAFPQMGRYLFGTPSGAMTPDLEAVAALVEAAGWSVTRSPRIRDEIWTKLQNNAAFNPLSALTRATMQDLFAEPMIGPVRAIIAEVAAVASALGARIEGSPEERVAKAGGVGRQKTSMLQDVELGRRLEFVPISRAVGQMGRLAGVPTPVNDTVTAMITQLDRWVGEGRPG